MTVPEMMVNGSESRGRIGNHIRLQQMRERMFVSARTRMRARKGELEEESQDQKGRE